MSEPEKFVLAKFCANYADEFDVYGFQIFTEEEWEACKQTTEAITDEIQISFGSNEDLVWDSGVDLLLDIKVREISSETVQILKDLFWDGSWGFFPDL